MNIQFRPCQKNDVNEAVPLMFSAGPEAFRYVFSVDYAEQALDFLRYAFVKGQGEFGFKDHRVALVNNEIIGLVGRRCSKNNTAYTLSAIKQILGFYGLFKGVRVMLRGFRFEAIVAPPSKGVVCLHNLGVSAAARGQGYGRQIIEHFIQSEHKHKTARVCLDVAETNPRAKALYLKLGFVVKQGKKGTLKNSYGRGVSHEYMEINLS